MSVSSHYSFILSMTEEVSFMRFGKHATPQTGSMCVCVQPCDPRENFFPFVFCIRAGACSTIGILHATKLLPMVGRSQGRLTLYLQKKGMGPCAIRD